MNNQRDGRGELRRELNRRDFLRVAASAGAVGAGVVLLGACGSDDGNGSPMRTQATVVDTPPETTTIRLTRVPSLCVAPQYVAEEFLLAEGFTDVRYTSMSTSSALTGLASGDVDISMVFAAPLASAIDAGYPVHVLAGAHVGCFELFGSERVRSLRDLKDKTVAVTELEANASDYTFISSMLTYVGMNPATDVNFEAHPKDEAIRLLAADKIDAYLAFPPTGQQLRSQKIGRLVMVSHHDPPWSQYFCCMVTASNDFYSRHPVAAKRALRAILKGADACVREPERAARFVVDKGYTDNYEYMLETLKMVPYNVWREFNPEDTLRFYALRLNEAGIIKKTPDEIIRRGTDWRMLEELKQELKDA